MLYLGSSSAITQTMQNAAAATGNGTTFDVNGNATAVVSVTGTFVGTITFEGSDDDTNWVSMNAINVATLAIATTATAPGSYRISIAGIKSLRARVSAFTSGTITAKGRAVAIDSEDPAMSGTVTINSIPAGSAIIGKVGIDQTTPGTTNAVAATLNAETTKVIGTVNLSASQTLATVTNLSQLGGQAVAMGTGARSAGTLRVTIATDDSVPVTIASVPSHAVTNAGTFAVQSSLAPATTGGLSTFHLVSAATTNATNIKASAGQVFGWFIYNSNAAYRKVAFHNTAGTPTAGASIFFSIVIPPGSGANVEFTNGIAFSTGIAITAVTGIADSDTAAVAVSDLVINIFYK